jgi:hypothetical protein
MCPNNCVIYDLRFSRQRVSRLESSGLWCHVVLLIDTPVYHATQCHITKDRNLNSVSCKIKINQDLCYLWEWQLWLTCHAQNCAIFMSDISFRSSSMNQLVPRSRKCGSIQPLPHTPSWRSAKLVKHRDNFTYFCFLHLRWTDKSLLLYALSRYLKGCGSCTQIFFLHLLQNQKFVMHSSQCRSCVRKEVCKYILVKGCSFLF